MAVLGILLMIEILHNLIKHTCRNYGVLHIGSCKISIINIVGTEYR